MSYFPWPDEAVADLKRLWLEGRSSTFIADHLGKVHRRPLSRSAVMGKLVRLGFNNASRGMKRGHTAMAKPPKVRAPRLPKVTFVAQRGPAMTPQPAMRLPVILEDMTFARPWEERGSGQCCWPIGEPGAILSCCAPTEDKYCPAHYARMFRPNTAMDKGTVRHILRKAA